MYKCHQIGKSQVNDYVHVFFSLSPHNTEYTAPKESVIFIDEKIRRGLCSTYMATFMYALKILLNIRKAVNTTFQERWI